VKNANGVELLLLLYCKVVAFRASFRCSDPQLSARQEIPSHHDTKVSELKSPSFRDLRALRVELSRSEPCVLILRFRIFFLKRFERLERLERLEQAFYLSIAALPRFGRMISETGSVYSLSAGHKEGIGREKRNTHEMERRM
jgi:hypothetical protein